MTLDMMLALSVGLICFGASIGAALGDSKAVASALEGIARQPEMEGSLVRNMIIGIGLIESIPIISIVIAFMLFFKI